MFTLLHISGSECTTVLSRFGYRVDRRSGGLTAMHRDANVVYVPEASLSAAVVRAILRTAKIDPFDFVRELDGIGHRPTFLVAPAPPVQQVA